MLIIRVDDGGTGPGGRLGPLRPIRNSPTATAIVAATASLTTQTVG